MTPTIADLHYSLRLSREMLEAAIPAAALELDTAASLLHGHASEEAVDRIRRIAGELLLRQAAEKAASKALDEALADMPANEAMAGSAG